MGRRREESFIEDAFELLKMTPFWVGPALAATAFGLLRLLAFVLVAKTGPADFERQLLPPVMSIFAWFIASGILLAWVAAEAWKLVNRRLLNRQTGIGSIRDLSWQGFERLVCEAYRRKGYLSEVVGRISGDGGVDVKLAGHGQSILVQCKQWRAYTVGVTTVRELLGVVVSERATKGIVVTSGRFTRKARAFADRNPQIELVDGRALAELVRNVQVGTAPSEVRTIPPPVHPPACPRCGARMVIRTARRGQYVGSQFWGCATYPACRGTRECPIGAVGGQ